MKLRCEWKKSFKKRSVPFKWGTNNDLNAKVFYKSVNANSLQKKYFDDNSLLKKYVTKEKFEEIKNEFSRGNTSIMTVVITIELYLRTLAEKKLI